MLLLTYVFEKFIKWSLKYYGLDPCLYFSSPGLSGDATLKMTEIELELISDVQLHFFIEKGMAGGISHVAKRYSKANDKYMTDYDNSKESIYIVDLDTNNLVGWPISKYLPYGGFKCLSQKEI